VIRLAGLMTIRETEKLHFLIIIIIIDLYSAVRREVLPESQYSQMFGRMT